ncbi:aromatic amino acid DMT transporter YddG [Vibrio sp. TH_r3]|uniref:aromatic amino acid DMT transporter YddG n=1 Tax=Vibrio sp. TH_r3 TaxID=3082084 RepID=UPI002954AE33|nr:aromatic amino acid DMT transporter YddG [Vibrio sp. TH_r3]MDV7103069.1 aromatic amino acid DMT transporter YddG [Vibrio sp. TH_r3]
MLVKYKHTLLGIIAILLWACLVGLTRSVAEQFGAVGGAALIYTVASVLLYFTIGIPKFRLLGWKNIVIAGGLFAAYEVCFSLALGFANDRHQTIEMAVINYLWPSLTVLLAVFVSNKKVSWLIYPSILLSFVGVVWSLTGDEGLSISQFTANVATNPLAYTLALAGAFIWAIYCNVTKKLSNGYNGITLFFIFTSIVLWVHYFSSDQPPLIFTLESSLNLLVTAIVMGSGYALWNIAIIGGNMLFLATLSYFTPILSTVFSIIILGIAITATFWQGVVLVTIGSFMCWWVTKENN